MIRNYNEKDKLSVLKFLSNCITLDRRSGYFHPGDFIYRSYFANPDHDPVKDIVLFIDDREQISGMAWYHKKDYAEIFIHPDLPRYTIEEKLYSWIKQKILDDLQNDEEIEFAMGGMEDDPEKDKFLFRHNFEKMDEPAENDQHFMLKIENYQLDFLPGKEFRLINIYEKYFNEIIEDRKEWLSVADYVKMSSQPYYNNSLDLAYITPNGQIAAYAICWYDIDSKTAVLEPLYTNEKFRRNGLAQALICEQIKRLKKMGAQSLFVTTIESNIPAILCYEKVGFKKMKRDLGWIKKFKHV